MKQQYRHNAAPTFESLTRAALKQVTRQEMLAAKFADDIKSPRVATTDLITKPEPSPRPEPLKFSLADLLPATLAK